jgi:hypothetical protein
MERKGQEDKARVITNLLRSGELTSLCRELRKAVLKKTHADQDVEKMLAAEIRQSKERAWRRNPS